MKPSDLPKDKMTTVRVNEKIKELIKREGFSIQSIIDQFIDAKFSVMIEKENEKENSR